MNTTFPHASSLPLLDTPMRKFRFDEKTPTRRTETELHD
jgi:hypothetical protein